MMSYPLLYVIVLNHSHREDTNSCIATLLKSNYENFRIILLESTSAGEAVQEFRSEDPRVQTIRLTENLGYAGNNNVGIQAALDQEAEWVFILNNDTVLDPACLSLLIENGELDRGVGIVGPMVYHFDQPDVIQSAGGILGKNWQSNHAGINQHDTGQFKTVRQVDWISGCAILVRRALIEDVGALDPDYFLYWEEIEWCLRARRAGWKILHIPQAKLWHKGVNQDYQPRPYVTYYMTRNFLHTLFKHNAPIAVRLFALFNVFRTLVSWSIKPQWRFKREHRDAMWKGLIDFLHRRLGSMPL